MGDRLRAHLVVSGLVQGVFFRATARDQGVTLGLAGWVRNLDSGGVEACVEGDARAVDAFVDWCHRGPPYARVEGVRVERSPFVGDMRGFFVRR